MKISVISGAGGTLGDDMVYSVIKDWLSDMGVEVGLSLPIGEVDGVILGGCGIIYDEGVVLDVKGNPERYHNYIKEAITQGIPCIGLGLGWQGIPLTVGEELWAETLSNLDFLTVWNHQTKTYLESIYVINRIVATADLGFGLTPRFETWVCDFAILTHNPRLMAVDCHKPEWEDMLTVKLSRVIRELSRKHSIGIFPFSYWGNDALFGMAKSSGSVLVQGEPHRVMGMISNSEVCITTTLHALIMAVSAGCNVLALYPPEPLKPKIRWMAEELGVRSLPFDADEEMIISGTKFPDNPIDISSQVYLNMTNRSLLKKWINGLR